MYFSDVSAEGRRGGGRSAETVGLWVLCHQQKIPFLCRADIRGEC